MDKMLFLLFWGLVGVFVFLVLYMLAREAVRQKDITSLVFLGLISILEVGGIILMASLVCPMRFFVCHLPLP